MIRALRLQNLRAHRDYFMDFGPGVNVVVGPNGCGKTTILEAIYLCMRGGTFRGSAKDLISDGAEWSRVDMKTDNKKDVVLKISIKDNKASKEFYVGGQTQKRLVPTKRQPVVLFEPEDLRIVSGSPQRRRDFIDSICSKLIPEHQTLVNKYKKAIQQRNSLLKSGAPDKDFFAWDVQLASYGDKIISNRAEITDSINKLFNDHYSQTSNKQDEVSIRYEGEATVEMLTLLKGSLVADRKTKTTCVGPHRHDLEILINNSSSRSTASRGEARSMVLALKSIEFDLLRKQYGVEPTLLLDDVFSELDGQRRRSLTKMMSRTQTIITTTDADLALSIKSKTLVKPIA